MIPRAATSQPNHPGARCASGCLVAAIFFGVFASPAVLAEKVAAVNRDNNKPAEAAATAAKGGQSADAAAPYVDRVLDQSTLANDGLGAPVDTYDASGWPRSVRVDYSLLSQRGVGSGLNQAISISGFLDTPNYGAISGLANFVSNRNDSFGSRGASGRATSSLWRIDQRALPLDGGWIANHSLGTTSSFSVPLARSIGRVFLPTTPIEGAAGQWLRPDGLEFNASAGRVGLFNGYDVNGFSQSGGNIFTGGGQMRLFGGAGSASRADAAVQLIDTRNVPVGGFGGYRGYGNGAVLTGPVQDVRGVWTALSWEGASPWGPGLSSGRQPMAERIGGLRVQGNLMQSHSSLTGNALGGWLDAAWRTQLLRNTAGVFYFDPGLTWGSLSRASDLRGLYWRAETSSRQWNLGWSTEVSDSVSGLYGGASFFASVYGRYRLDSRNAVGTTLSARTGNGSGQGISLFWDRIGDWGTTQWRGDYTRVANGTAARAGVDQVWRVGETSALTTSLGYERRSDNLLDPVYGPIPAYSAWTWGLLGSASPWGGVRLDASVRGASGSGASALNANVGATWQIGTHWALAARYTESRGRDPLSPILTSALAGATQTVLAPTPANRTFQLVLRWEDRAGSARAPIGGRPGSGSGSLVGTVFLDEDRNGQRGASEAGVAGVSVVLDRRYVVRTDAQGHYEFPAVAAGEHLIEVQADNVPLPWSPIETEPSRTDVFVRQQTTRDFSLQKDR